MTYHRPPAHWETTTAEEAFLDLPLFDSLMDRARHFVEAMGQSYLHTLTEAGETVSPDDPVFERGDGSMASLNDLVGEMEKLEIDYLTGGWLDDDGEPEPDSSET